MSVGDSLLELAHTDEHAVLFTVVEGPQAGARLLVLLDRDETVGDAPATLAELAPGIRRNGMHEVEGMKVFAEVYGPPPRLVVVGAVDTAEALCSAAGLLGWHTIVVDPRPLLATRERIPSADELILEWPDDALAHIAPDHNTAVVTLAHDEKFDVPTLKAALRSEAFYVGAIGSRRTQAKRRERLLEEGLTEAELAQVYGPAGLDIGADTPAEQAISMLSEALAVKAGRRGTPLKTAASRIHVEE
ncbi:MAG TPA: XdhC family protein [Gaiellaceae bacterium]|nr:XdhC family protein [Gaiellaceae bacterium]